eukprot:5177140-Alexandrium_andersonii.AAC.1
MCKAVKAAVQGGSIQEDIANGKRQHASGALQYSPTVLRRARVHGDPRLRRDARLQGPPSGINLKRRFKMSPVTSKTRAILPNMARASMTASTPQTLCRGAR